MVQTLFYYDLQTTTTTTTKTNANKEQRKGTIENCWAGSSRCPAQDAAAVACLRAVSVLSLSS